MKRRLVSLSILFLVLLSIPGSALAQDYSFELPQLTVHVYWNEDGSQSLDYIFVFDNDPSGHAIEYVDLGLPNGNFVVNSISAEADGKPLSYVSESDFQGEGSDGVAIGLGAYAIPPGESGSVRIYVGRVNDVLYPDDQGDDYASAVFRPAYFISSVVHGSTDLAVTFHLPPGVQPEEPRWHAAPAGFPAQPETGFDDQGRIVYTWRNPNANGYTQYEFGASFPGQYVPESAIVRPNPFAFLSNIRIDVGACVPCGFIAFIAFIIVASVRSSNKRKLQYLPPKVTLEGHGIKRGLTAVEAAILLEQPLDKVLTMTLFSVIKKNAAEVSKRDPLELKVVEPLPKGLHSYEVDFLHAFQETGAARRKKLQEAVINLVKGVSKKIKGFSRKETVAYYRDITKRAWAQVEAADTPEVKSQKFDEVMEWTMLDRDYDDRTRDVFRHHPVFVPTWWGRYDPAYRPAAPKTAGMPISKPSTTGTGLPHLPGADFAASMVTGVQGFSSKVVGNITDFTNQITSKTNPIPKASSSGRSYSGGSGGSSCACACASAGCACACAGGGR